MAAPILGVHLENPQPRVIDKALSVLQGGGLIAYPTDTYYGVGCSLSSKKGIDRLYTLKQRDRKKPMSLLCADLSGLTQYAHVSNFAYRTLKRLAPGPFTFILEATRAVPELMMSRQKQVGLRIPDSSLVKAIVSGLGHPLVTTSATTPEGDPLLDARDIKDVLGHGIDLILDGGYQPSEPSTIVSLVGDSLEVLRQGKGEVD